MIPNHLLDGLRPDDRIAVLSRDGELHFLVHPASDDPAAVRVLAERQGSEVLATHMRDHAAIRELVASRERDVGGEG